jgi:hypothetical protein
MSLARVVMALVEELCESLDTAAGKGEAAARRWLRRIETSLETAAHRLRIRRLEIRFDELRAATARRWADTRRAYQHIKPDMESFLAQVRSLGRRLEAERRNLEGRRP